MQKIFNVVSFAKETLVNFVKPGEKLTNFAKRVCEEHDFRDDRGNLQVSSCVKALKCLKEKFPNLPIPESTHKKPRTASQPTYLDEPVPEPVGVPPQAEDVKNLELHLVESKEDRLLWNTIMRDHPVGIPNTVIGHQIRLIVKSEYGYLGGFLLSSAFLHVECRDISIGWSREERKSNLEFPPTVLSTWLQREAILPTSAADCS